LPEQEPVKADPNSKDSDGKPITVDQPVKPTKSRSEQFLGPWAKDLNISGGFNTRFQSNEVSGGAGAQQVYNDQNLNVRDFRSLGPLQQNMDLTIQGKVFNAFSVNARLTNSRYGNQYNQIFGFNYRSKGTGIDLGNVNAALPGNSLVTFNRSLQGIVFSRDFGGSRLRTTGIASLTQAVTRRGNFQGNGTNGPYYMNASNIIEGSEKVRLNGRDLRVGTDYTIDYLLGQLTFPPGVIINQNDTIEFTYESRNYNTQPGLLFGNRWDYSSPQGHTYGITYLQQKASGARVGNGNISERFPVVGDLTYRYQLSSLIDSTIPVRLYYYDRLLADGIDYVLNKDLRFFQLKVQLPVDTSYTGTASLRADYRPLRQNSVTGDRAVMGLDSVIKLGKSNTLNLQYGRSNGVASTQNGQALTMEANFQSPGTGAKNAWKLTTGFRNIGQGFSSIDSVASAFLQAEQGFNTTFSITPNAFYSINTAFGNSRVANRSYATTVTSGSAAPDAVVWANNQTFNTGINLQFPERMSLPTFTLGHQQTTQRNSDASGTTSKFASDTLSANWSKSFVTVSTNFNRTSSQGRSVFASSYNNAVTTQGQTSTSFIGSINDGTFQQSLNDSTSLNARYQVQLRPASWVDFTTDFGTSYTSASSSSAQDTVSLNTSSNGSTARNLGFTLGLRPLTNMELNASYIEGTNGQSTAGFYNSNSNSSALSSLVSGQRTRTTSLAMQYIPWANLTLNSNLSRSLSLVPGYDNTKNNTLDMGATWQVARQFQTSFGYMNQNVQYVGGQGDSSNRSLTLTGSAGPFGRLLLTSSFTNMQFGSAVYNSGNSLGASAGVGGGVGVGSNIFGSSNSVTGSGLLQAGTNSSWVLRTDYSVGGNRSLFMQWRALDQYAPLSASGSSGFTSGGTTYRSANNYKQGIGTVGFEWRFTEIMGFTLDMNLVNQSDREDPKFSYRARSLNMDLSARF